MEDRKKTYLNLIRLGLLVGLILVGLFIWRPAIKTNRLLNKAEKAEAQGQSEKVESLLEEATAVEGPDGKAVEKLINFYLDKRDYSKAKAQLDRMGPKTGESLRYRKLLYRYAMESQNFALADSLLDTEPSYQPSEEEYLQIIKGLNQLAYNERAVKRLEEAGRAFPESGAVLQLGFRVYYDAGMYREAVALYENESSLTLSYQDMNTLAELYRAQDKGAQAAKLWEESLDTVFGQRSIQGKLYNYYIDTDQVTRVWSLREKLLEKHQALPKPLYNLWGNQAWQTRFTGLFAKEGSTTYFSDLKNQILYRKVGEAGDFEPFLEMDAMGLNVKQGILYFTRPSDQSKLYAYNLATQELEKKIDESCHSPLVFGPYLYYLDEHSELRRYSIEDRSIRKLETGPVLNYIPIDRGIYYIKEDGNLYFMALAMDKMTRVQARDVELVLSGPFKEVVNDEFGRLYLIQGENGAILDFDPLSRQVESLYQEASTYLNYANRTLFFVTWTPQAYSLVNKNQVNLASNISQELYVFQDRLYSVLFLNNSHTDYEIYQMKTDGSEWKIFQP